MKFAHLLAIDPTNLKEIVAPITGLINAAVPVLLTLVGSLGLIWCIVLGVRYAKADDPQEHEKAKKALVNAVVGFILIFVLLIMVEVGLTVFTDYWSEYEPNLV